MKGKFKLRKIDFDGIIYILESIFGLLLTLIIFVTIFNKKESINDSAEIGALVICFCIDIWLLCISVKMNKRTHERNYQLERHPDQQTGISSKILVLEKKKKYMNTTKIIIEALSLYFFMLA